MDSWITQRIISDLMKSQELIEEVVQDKSLINAIEEVSNIIIHALNKGKKILLAGNGGSAADAQHIAGEFVSRFNFDRAPLPAIALTTDTSILTSIGNDYGFEHLFSRQVKAFGQSGDIFIGITTSGKSPNVLEGLKAARGLGLITIGLSGSSTEMMQPLCTKILSIPSINTPLVQQLHITLGHTICTVVEESIFKTPNRGESR